MIFKPNFPTHFKTAYEQSNEKLCHSLYFLAGKIGLNPIKTLHLPHIYSTLRNMLTEAEKMTCELYHGDCLEILDSLIKKGTKVDAVITDPPYGTTACPWDTVIPFDAMWARLKKIRKNNAAILLFGNEPFNSFLRISNINEYKYDIYWQKERATNIFQLKKRPAKVIETINVFYKEQPTYNPQMTLYTGPKRTNKIKDGKLGVLVDSQNRKPFEYNDTGKRYPLQIVQYKRDILSSNLHPTQKPVALMEYLVKTFSNEGDTILDFTMGSGSTGIACKNLNRNFIGIELDDTYFRLARKRIEEHQPEHSLFETI